MGENRPERRSATDPLLSKNHAAGTVYWCQFTSQHYQLLHFLTVLRPITSLNSCGICNSEQTPI